MSRKVFIWMAAIVIAGSGALIAAGAWPQFGAVVAKHVEGIIDETAGQSAKAPKEQTRSADIAVPVITVARASQATFEAKVRANGSLVARQEILVAPEVEGLRILTLGAEEGDWVKKGQTLATLVVETIDAQMAQNTANIARAQAAIAQAESQVVEAQARVDETRAAFERAKPLLKKGYLTQATYDQRRASARTADAQLKAARDGIKLAEAEKAQLVAQRREIAWRLNNAKVTSPADGIVSRRNARIGGLAAGAGEPMFRIIANGEIELEADVAEAELARLKPGQVAEVSVAGADAVQGKVRLVAPEIDKTTRLGRVRIFLGVNSQLKIGAFGRVRIATAKATGLAVPASSVLFDGENRARVLAVVDGKVERRPVETGLRAGGHVEIRAGLKDGDLVVAKSGTFLRDGDRVRAIVPGGEGDAKFSEAR